MARGRGPADINLTLGINPEFDARRMADEMTRGFKQAGNQAGVDYNESFTRQIDQLEPRVSRAMRKVSAALLQVDEAGAKVAQRFQENARDQEALTAATEKYNRVAEEATSTDQDRADALEELSAAQDRHAQSTRALIAERAKYNRANATTASGLAAVNKALEDIGNEESAGQTLLTVGKFISALRAVAIPAIGGVVAATGASALSIAAAATQGLWMIPAAAGAATAGIATLNLATMGFSDTVKEMGDPEKFAEAIQSLSPNAQQAALAIQALTDPLTQLKNATQDALFADFGPMINELANQYLPMIQQLTTGVAGAFNSAVKGLFDQLMTPETQQVLANTVDSIVKAFQNLAPAVAPIVNAITRIVETGASFLPELAQGAANAAQEFSRFITAAQNSGELERWFREGLDTLGQLWEGVKSLARTFMDLAPAGRQVLPEILEILKAMELTIPPIISGLTSVVTPIGTIAQATNNMWAMVGPIWEKFSWAIDRVGDAIKNVINLIPGLGPTLRILELANRLMPGGSPSAPTGNPALDLANRYAAADSAAKGNPFGSVPLPGYYRTRDGKMRPIPNSTVGGGGFLGTAGLAPFPTGGYAVPPPPPEKGGKGSKADEPPFTADPSTYSLDSIPIGSFFGDASGGAVAGVTAPLAAEAPMVALPDITRANNQIDALAAMAQAFNLSTTSDVRNEPGSWHHVGQAGDFSNSSGPTAEMHAFATYLAQNFGGMIEELIYSDPVRGDVLIGGGRFVGPGTDQPNYYDAATRAGHMDHVHVAVTDAMAPFLQAALQGNTFGGFGAGGGMAGYGGYVAVDQEKIAKAEADRDQARRTVEEKRLAFRKLEASGEADQLQMLRAKNDVIDAENNLIERERAVQEARMGTYKEFDDKLQNSAKQVTGGLSQVGAQLANDFGISEGLPGIAKWITTFLANMAFAPMIGALSAVSAVSDARTGTTGGSGLIGMFAPPVGPMDQSAMGPTPLGGGVGAPLPGQAQNLPFPMMKFDSGGMLPPGGIGVNMTSKPEPVLTPDQWSQVQTAMQSATPVPHGTTGGTPPGPQGTSMAPSQVGGGGFTGLGGLPLQGIQMAAMGLDAFAPGAGAAAQIGIQLANRAAGYIGQLAGIGVGGLLETFLPNNSTVADPNKSWLGKIASGISGARPATANVAGGAAPAKPPVPQPAAATAGGGGPVVLIENMVNNTTDGGQTVANQMARQAQTGYLSRMGAR